nr:unnamed protein product [Digitaria exilis]
MFHKSKAYHPLHRWFQLVPLLAGIRTPASKSTLYTAYFLSRLSPLRRRRNMRCTSIKSPPLPTRWRLSAIV